jgi:uncharacterized membrane protein (DUF2068 family)
MPSSCRERKPGPSEYDKGMAEENGIAPIVPAKPPLGLLGWIAGYKLLKSAGMLALAIGSLQYAHGDLLPLLRRGVAYFDLDPHGRFIAAIGDRLMELTSTRFQFVRGALFFYFVLFAIEGVGLLLEKVWAEWLTVLATALLLPPAGYELVLYPTLSRFIFVQFNIGLIGYLLWRLRRDAAWAMHRQMGG